ncbi:MAG: hypothetical protein F6K19_01130 [Cyanothece sp. SIO1E1]|nr:hypothetical protein [Cyanothece sp. SIO1E1]
MARYTSLFTVTDTMERVWQSLIETLESCDLNIIYESRDYLVAREKPGQVSFSQLVTLEALIDRSLSSQEATHLSLVVKNEELPLQTDNHCYQRFNFIIQAIEENPNCQMIENVAG